MNSRQNYLVLFLSLTSVAGGIVAWQQHQELIQLRAAHTARPQPLTPTKALPLSVQDSSVVSAEPAVENIERLEARPNPEEAVVSTGRPNRRDGPGPNHRAMLESPEIQRLMAIQQKSALDSPYSALFRNLSLSPEQLERFKDLLVEKRTATGDVRSAAREQGINARSDPATFEKLMADTQAEIDASIRETIGEAGFAKYQSYEKTLPQRSTVNQLEQRLSYSSTPLTNQQSEQLVGILAATSRAALTTNGTTAASLNMGPTPAVFQGRGRETRITDATINQSLGVLAAPQVEALRQLQQEQQAQTALNAAMRNRFREDSNTAAPTQSPNSAASTGPTPVTQPRPSGG